MATLNESILRIALTASRRLAARWHIPADDIKQEILLWCLIHGIDDSFEDIEDEGERESALRQATASIRWAGERYCRKEKASATGYSVEDEAFYSAKALAELLLMYYQAGIEEHAPTGRTDSVRQTTTDGAEYGNHLASMLDVERGLELLPLTYSMRLRARFGLLGHLSDGAIASLSQSEIRELTGMHHDTLRGIVGTTPDQVRHRTATALRKLQSVLGGPNPWNKGPTPRAAMVA